MFVIICFVMLLVCSIFVFLFILCHDVWLLFVVNLRILFIWEVVMLGQGQNLLSMLQELKVRCNEGESLSGEIFNAMLALMPSPNVELVVYRKHGDKVDVLLVQRPEDVASYPGEWHCPGSMWLPHFKLEDVFERTRVGKLQGASIRDPVFVGIQPYDDPSRGDCTIVRLVHRVESLGDMRAGRWFPYFPESRRALPEKLVWEQPMLLDLALQDFR